jgi:hypothetical protein
LILVIINNFFVKIPHLILFKNLLQGGERVRNRWYSILLLLIPFIIDAGETKQKIGIDINRTGELRFGGIYVNSIGKKSYTLSLGGKVALEAKSIYGVTASTTFYTTNALFGKNSEAMFLDSEGNSYSIIGEAFIKAKFHKTQIKMGRQIFESPFIDSDDIGMVPNTIEGYILSDRTLQDTTIILGLVNSWSGIDANRPEQFTKMQSSGDDIAIAGLIYKGFKNTTLQVWQYGLDGEDWNYFEANYESNKFSIAGQYSDQDSGNYAYGLDGILNINNLSIHIAYNKIYGVMSNGFGGGPFFTSSEDHTIEEVLNQEAKLAEFKYKIDNLTLSLIHVDFDKGENETDYLLNYSFGDNLSLNLIYSEMYNDGRINKFFVNYSF